MDIKISSDLPATKPAISPGDLLARLKAAGTLEAQVVRLLQGNQLLLSSRLGDILTSNSLDYKPGDRLILRFDDSRQQAVLKASPQTEKPVILDSRQYPELSRALASDRPRLATVIRIVAQQAEIRLADQILRLPRQAAPSKNQLLSLRRNAANHNLEITRIDRKAIYKAILKQLVPQQTDNRSSSLVKLLKLLDLDGAARQHATMPQPSSPLRAANSAPHPRDGAPAGAARAKLQSPGPAATGSSAAIRSKASPAVTVPDAQLKINPAQHADPAARATTPVNPASSRSPDSNAIALDAQRAPAGAPRIAAPERAVSAAPAPPKAGPLNPRDGITAVTSGRATEQLAAGATSRHHAVTGNRADQIKNPGSGNEFSSWPPAAAAVQSRPVPAPTATAAGPPAATMPAGQAPGTGVGIAQALLPLLQLVTRFPDIDAGQLKKWFEFARLIYPSRATPAAPPPADMFRLLQQVGVTSGAGRETPQGYQQNQAAQAGSDSPAGKAQAQEAQLLNSREGLRLIEHSLSQNLLQRASLGLQQETQQPLALSLALPFREDQETKPLYIDLAQRNQAPQTDAKSWDIRLSFELAGLGSIACHLVLEGCSVAASFYSEQAQTRERIDAELPQLRRQLSQAGFAPGEFHSFPGKPAPGPTPAVTGYSESLLDIEV